MLLGQMGPVIPLACTFFWVGALIHLVGPCKREEGPCQQLLTLLTPKSATGFPIQFRVKRKPIGSFEYDDLQSWLDMT